MTFYSLARKKRERAGVRVPTNYRVLEERENYPKGVTPECFNRGSTLLTTTLSSLSKGRGSSSDFAWIPA